MKQINPNKILSGLQVTEDTQAQEWAKRGYGCPKCDGYGNVITDEGAQYCRCKLDHFIKKRIAECGITAQLFDSRTFKAFKPKGVISHENWRLVQGYGGEFSEGNKGLILWGNNGLGKSHIAIMVAYYLLQYDHSVLYVTARRLLRKLRGSFDREATDTEYEIMRYYLSPDVLIIDDLTIRSDWQREVFEDIISERYDSTNQAMIITTNLNFRYRDGSEYPTLQDESGSRIASRLREMCHDIEFTGDDYRGKGNKP